MVTSRRMRSTVSTDCRPSSEMKVEESSRAARASGDSKARAIAVSSSNHIAEKPSNGAVDCSSRPALGHCM